MNINYCNLNFKASFSSQIPNKISITFKTHMVTFHEFNRIVTINIKAKFYISDDMLTRIPNSWNMNFYENLIKILGI